MYINTKGSFSEKLWGFINAIDILLFKLLGKKQVIEVWATKNFRKDLITGRVDILWLIFEKISKKVQILKKAGPRGTNSNPIISMS